MVLCTALTHSHASPRCRLCRPHDTMDKGTCPWPPLGVCEFMRGTRVKRVDVKHQAYAPWSCAQILVAKTANFTKKCAYAYRHTHTQLTRMCASTHTRAYLREPSLGSTDQSCNCTAGFECAPGTYTEGRNGYKRTSKGPCMLVDTHSHAP